MRSNRVGTLLVLRNNQMASIITDSDLCDSFIGMTAAKIGGPRIFIESDCNDSPIADVVEF